MPPSNRAACAITGMGVFTALGQGVPAAVDALRYRRDALTPATRFADRSAVPINARAIESSTHLASIERPAFDSPGRLLEMACAAAREALDDAGYDVSSLPADAALVLGASQGVTDDVDEFARRLAEALGIRGEVVMISTACTSSTNAIGIASEMLASKRTSLVIAGGVDEITLDLFAGFYTLGALAVGKCSPWGQDLGTTLGDGAGFVVLEPAAQRKPSHGNVLSFAASSDAYHETSPEPRGAGMAAAIRSALERADVTAGRIDYVSAHGTGTAANDSSESVALRSVFGDRSVAVGSLKGFIGHTQAAAGVIEVVLTLACREAGFLPANPRIEVPRSQRPRGLLEQRVAVASEEPFVFVKASAAFGGAHTALVIASHSFGLGATPDWTTNAEPQSESLAYHESKFATATSKDALAEDVVSMLQVETLERRDPMAVALTAALARAIRPIEAEFASSRIATFVVTPDASPSEWKRYKQSLREHGPTGVCVASFARLVAHASLGTATQLLELRGPAITLTSQRLDRTAAVRRAEDTLRLRDDIDAVIVATVREDESRFAEARATVITRSEAEVTIRRSQGR